MSPHPSLWPQAHSSRQSAASQDKLASHEEAKTQSQSTETQLKHIQTEWATAMLWCVVYTGNDSFVPTSVIEKHWYICVNYTIQSLESFCIYFYSSRMPSSKDLYFKQILFEISILIMKKWFPQNIHCILEWFLKDHVRLK